jgi:RNA polymerase sigma factor (sigma-70 family)
MSTTSPEHLLRELRAQAAWTRSVARALVGDPDAADDLVQESWIAALRHRPAVDRSLRGWLATVIRNRARNRHRVAERAARRERQVEQHRDAIESPEEALGRTQLHEQLARLVGNLSDPYRQTIVLRFFEGLSSAEIARRLGAPEGTIRWRLKTGLDELRRQLDREHGDRETWRRMLLPLAAAAPVPLAGRWLWKALAGSAAIATALVTGAALMPPAATPSTPAAPVTIRGATAAPATPAAPGAQPAPAAAAAATEVGYALSGQVLDVAVGPLIGARVVATRADDRAAASATTDQTGRYALRLRPGVYFLVAEADGYAPAEGLPVSLIADELRDFRMLPASALAGRVVDAQARPVAGAAVTAEPERPGRTFHALSGKEGDFDLRALPPGAYTLSAQLGPLASAAPTRVEVSVAQQLAGVTLELQPALAIAGVVRDTRNRPVANAAVALDEALGAGWGFWANAVRATSDAAGRYRIAGLRPGRYHLSARARPLGDAELRTVSVLDRDLTSVDLELLPGGVVEGRLLSATGAPVSGARVSLTVRAGLGRDALWRGSGSVQTDAHGRFRQDGLAAGQLTIEAHAPDGRRAQLGPRPFDPSGPGEPIVVRFAGSVFISGTVTSPDGTPASAARVRWLGMNDSVGEGLVAPVQAQGRFRVGPVPAEAGLLRAERLNANVHIGSSALLANEKALDLADGRDRGDVRLVLEPADRSLEGVVVSSEGRPLPDARVEAEPKGTESAWTRTPALADVDGRFRIPNLTRGPHEVWASAPGLPSSRKVVAEAGSRNLRLVVPRPASVAGVVLEPDGRPARNARVRLLPAGPDRLYFTSGLEEGRTDEARPPGASFTFTGLAPMHYQIWASSPGGRIARPASFVLRPGEGKTGLRLVLGPAVTVQGQVLDHHTGAPLADIGINLPWTSEHLHARTDGRGIFRLENLVPGQALPVMVRGDENHIVDRWDVTWPASGGEHTLPPFRLLPVLSRARAGCSLVTRGFALDYPPGGPTVSDAPPATAGNPGPRVGDQLLSMGGKDVRGLGEDGLCHLQATLGPRIEFVFTGPDGARRSTHAERPPARR